MSRFASVAVQKNVRDLARFKEDEPEAPELAEPGFGQGFERQR